MTEIVDPWRGAFQGIALNVNYENESDPPELAATSIEALKEQNLYKVPKILESPAGGRVRMNGKEVVNLASNNYLGLANHPKGSPGRSRLH